MLDSFKSWWSQPFESDMDVVHWALFFLLVVMISLFWGVVLRAAQRTVGEITA